MRTRTSTAAAGRSRSPRRSPTPTTARSCAPSCRSGPVTTATTARSASSTWPAGWVSTRPSSARCPRRRSAREHDVARDGAGLLGLRQRRRAPDAAVRHEDRRSRRQGDLPGRTAGQRVLPEQVARTETQMLTEVLKSGTGTRARLDRPAAGKTGTTDDNRTPGSSGTRRSSPPRCGWATRTQRRRHDQRRRHPRLGRRPIRPRSGPRS